MGFWGNFGKALSGALGAMGHGAPNVPGVSTRAPGGFHDLSKNRGNDSPGLSMPSLSSGRRTAKPAAKTFGTRSLRRR